ncbi:MAG: hypothetical protein ACU0BS_05990 [Hasllibacter sp.]
MKIRTALAAPLALLATLAPAAARTITFDCQFPNVRAQWVSGPVRATVGPDGSGQATGFVIEAVNEGPVAAELVVDNDRRWTVRYELRDVSARGQSAARLVYRLTVQKAGGAAAISMTPAGYSNSFQNDGACRVSAG